MTSNDGYSHNEIDPIDQSIREVDHVSSITTESVQATTRNPNKKDYIIVLILFIINLLNYTDRFSIAGILDTVQKYYRINQAESGVIQTSFIVVYMLMSPLFGYLGDRYNRKKLLIFGIAFWCVLTLASSFVPRNLFSVFVILRSLVGIGEASYSTIAPTIITDIFIGDVRTKMLAFFYFAVPVGSGFGYIMGFGMYRLFNQWQFALRLSPIIGLICVLLLVFFVKEPARGRAEGGTHLAVSPWSEDIRQLTKNPSFMLISFAFTCASFVLGALAWYSVSYLESLTPVGEKDNVTAYVFGVLTMVAGICGVIIGTETGRRLRVKNPSADTLVCGFGLIISGPLILIALCLTKDHYPWALTIIFFGQTALCLNWALVTDMTMAVVIPPRRATASAYQMILCHAFGDAISPYIIGAVKDSLENWSTMTAKFKNDSILKYYSFQYSLFINPFVAVLGGALFLCASFFYVNDRNQVKKLIEESRFHYETVGSDYLPEDSQTFSESSRSTTQNVPNII